MRCASLSVHRVIVAVAAGALIAMSGRPAQAATLCVNPSGSGGCYSSIQAALDAAHPHDTVRVANGTYYEGVIISKPVSLVGESDDRTVIDALGHGNAVHVDGMDNPGLRRVVVTKFKIQHASFEGVLITNASYVTLADNDVVENDRNLAVVAGVPSCPGLPSFETSEDFDCGESIHLSGVTHSTVAGNYITRNAGGILISDELGATSHNVVSENVVVRNPYECGITLAAHPAFDDPTTSYPIVDNAISDNDVSENGLSGEGAGVGLFAVPGIGGTVARNLVLHNRLVGNSIPGVAFHSHAPGDNLNNNVIVDNYIARNGADRDDSVTPGPTGINVYGASPIRGTLILKNRIEDEQIDVAANTAALVSAHLNALFDSLDGVDNLGPGSVDATENWWGCPAGPGAAGCTNADGPNVTTDPWLARPFTGTDDEGGAHHHHRHDHHDHHDQDHR